MGKRNRKTKGARSSADEREFSAGPLRVRQRGTHVEMTNVATAGQMASVRKALAEWKRGAPSELEQDAERVLEALQDIDPVTVLGVAFFHYHLRPVLAGEAMETSYAIIEHLALLLAKQERAGQVWVVDQTAGDALFDYLDHHLDAAIQLALPDMSVDPDEKADPFDDVVFNVRMWEMTVRAPRYDHQEKELLRKLFDPFAHELRAALGFTCEDAMNIESALITRIEATAREGLAQARQTLDDVDQALRGKEPVNDEVAGLVDLLRQRPDRDPMETLRGLMGAWVGFRTGDSLAPTVDELTDETGLAKDVVKRALGALTTTQSDLTNYAYAVPLSPLKSKPLIAIADRFLMPSPGLFLPALQIRFEQTLKARTAWEAYQTHRGAFAEERAAALFVRVLPGAIVRTNLK